MTSIINFIKKVVSTLTEMPLEDKLKREADKSKENRNNLNRKKIMDQLNKIRDLFKRTTEERLLSLNDFLIKEYKGKKIILDFEDEETLELILKLIKKTTLDLENIQLLNWYLHSAFEKTKNKEITETLQEQLGIGNRVLFSSVTKSNIYSRKDAADYANKHYSNYNKKYPNFGSNIYQGGDCANFISQCLYAGGMKWTIKSSQYTKAENWWCKPGASDKDGDARISLTWKTTYGFKNHWKSRATKYHSLTADNMKKNWSQWLEDLNRGDVIQLADDNGKPYHTLMICNYAHKDFKLAAHTNDTNSTLLKGHILEHTLRDSGRILVYIMD